MVSRAPLWLSTGLAASAAGQAARVAPQRGCVRRHLANRNEMRVSGSDTLRVAVLVNKWQRAMSLTALQRADLSFAELLMEQRTSGGRE